MARELLYIDLGGRAQVTLRTYSPIKGERLTPPTRSSGSASLHQARIGPGSPVWCVRPTGRRLRSQQDQHAAHKLQTSADNSTRSTLLVPRTRLLRLRGAKP